MKSRNWPAIGGRRYLRHRPDRSSCWTMSLLLFSWTSNKDGEKFDLQPVEAKQHCLKRVHRLMGEWLNEVKASQTLNCIMHSVAECRVLTYRDSCHQSGLQDAGVSFASFLDLGWLWVGERSNITMMVSHIRFGASHLNQGWTSTSERKYSHLRGYIFYIVAHSIT